MAKAVFTTKVDPSYDDLPETKYHFPRTYLRQAEQAVGDWIVYYEPRRPSIELSSRGGRQAYFATARLTRIEADPNVANHFYGFVDNYLEFDHPVPFRDGKFYYESGLQREDGNTNRGAFGRAVRPLPDKEYELILQAGFVRTIDQLDEDASTHGQLDSAYIVAEPTVVDRRILHRMISRPFREAAFAVTVKDAYHNTCAMSGLRIINGGGRAEVQAAHIRPVASQGPDSIRNGLALSGTVHWMFDRGLLSIDEDTVTILIARDRLPDAAVRLLNEDHRLILPERSEFHPHRQYLDYHRLNVFKG